MEVATIPNTAATSSRSGAAVWDGRGTRMSRVSQESSRTAQIRRREPASTARSSRTPPGSIDLVELIDGDPVDDLAVSGHFAWAPRAFTREDHQGVVRRVTKELGQADR